MNKNKTWFTLIEIIITLTITSFLFIMLALVLPNLSDNFINQKKRLTFQQTFTLDNFYINNKIINSENILTNYSSGTYNKNNSYLTLLNDEKDLNFSLIYLWNNTWEILSSDYEKWKVIVKNTFFYSDYVKVWNSNIYFTNPWEHTIYKYNIPSGNTTLVYWEVWNFWYSNFSFWIFNTPTGITYNQGINTLYVSDSWNNMIRSINLDTWLIQTVAWSQFKNWYNEWETSSTWTILLISLLDYPTWIEYDNNTIYLSDTYNNRIRKIDLNNNEIYTIFWSDDQWFNMDSWVSTNILLNYPLSILRTSNWLIFWDTSNWKIRYYNENDDSIITLTWIERIDNNTYNHFSKYTKNYYNTYMQQYWSWFYFNDLKNWIIYDYNFWTNNIIWDSDDTIINVLWNLDKDIFINWDIENNIEYISTTNDIIIEDSEIFYKTWDEFISPISWNTYLAVNTKWKTASWNIVFNSNLADWEKIQISDKIFEFDDWLLVYELWNIVVPIWNNIDDTIENFKDWLYNYDINYTSSWNLIKINSDNIWASWNNISFSWSSLNYTLSPNILTLTWWIEYTTWTKEFKFYKDLMVNEKYKLIFYISSDTNLNTNITEPLITINTGSWNIEEKILHIKKKWIKKEIIFNWKWINQKISFKVKYWEKIYIDQIKLIPISDVQLFDYIDKSKFQIWLLSNFYIIDNQKILLNNTLDKELLLLSTWTWQIINNNFTMFDYSSSNLNLKNDYKWDSIIEIFKYTNNKQNIIYDIWIKDYKLKISNNIK